MTNTHSISYSELDYMDENEQLQTLGLRVAQKKELRRKKRTVISADPRNDRDADALVTTYRPGLYEARWLGESLRGFLEEELIIDVLSIVKGGKEASVYRCQAGPAYDERIVAAKVYRPQQFRNLRNDAAYREGRGMIDLGRGAIRDNDRRSQTALRKKTTFGDKLRHVSWLSHEHDALTRLYDKGASVPRPLAVGENAILMEFVGDEATAAPTLSSVHLGHEELNPLFDTVIDNVRIMLELEMIHGDLSAYNMLYWEGDISLIDFPQVVDCYNNRQAFNIFQRDITRVCEYFATQGLERDAAQIARSLWDEHIQATKPDLWFSIDSSD